MSFGICSWGRAQQQEQRVVFAHMPVAALALALNKSTSALLFLWQGVRDIFVGVNFPIA